MKVNLQFQDEPGKIITSFTSPFQQTGSTAPQRADRKARELSLQPLRHLSQEFQKSDKDLPCKEKVKCALVQALRICLGRTARRGSRGIALLFLDHGTRRGWGVSVTPRPLFAPGEDLVPIVQEAGWASGSVCTGAENLAPTGIQSPDRPARSQSLYRLRYPTYNLPGVVLHVLTNAQCLKSFTFLCMLSERKVKICSV